MNDIKRAELKSKQRAKRTVQCVKEGKKAKLLLEKKEYMCYIVS
jgi:hypothetical protein